MSLSELQLRVSREISPPLNVTNSARAISVYLRARARNGIGITANPHSVNAKRERGRQIIGMLHAPHTTQPPQSTLHIHIQLYIYIRNSYICCRSRDAVAAGTRFHTPAFRDSSDVTQTSLDDRHDRETTKVWSKPCNTECPIPSNYAMYR